MDEDGAGTAAKEKLYDQVIEIAYAMSVLRDIQCAFAHKNAVKPVVKEALERRMPIRLTPNGFTSGLFQPASHFGGPRREHIGARVCEFGPIMGLDPRLGR